MTYTYGTNANYQEPLIAKELKLITNSRKIKGERIETTKVVASAIISIDEIKGSSVCYTISKTEFNGLTLPDITDYTRIDKFKEKQVKAKELEQIKTWPLPKRIAYYKELQNANN